MKKLDFLRVICLTVVFMIGMLCTGFAQGHDDFNTLDTNSSYSTRTTTNGWTCLNAAPHAGTYSFGTCERGHVVINGKTTAVGSITSPTLTRGCGTISLSYGNAFSESNGARFLVQVKNSQSVVVFTDTVANTSMTKGETYTYSGTVNVEGAFTIYILNLSPSNSTGNKDRLAISCIAWTAYGDAPTVETPVFDPQGGTYFAAQNVAISTTTANASIYYTTDGSDPKTNGILYVAEQTIPVTETTTLKAVAIKGNDTSYVATAQYTLNIPTEVSTIAAFKSAEGEATTIYKIANDVTVVGQFDGKKHTFIKDATGALYIFGTVSNEYNNGDVISGGVFGKRSVYHQLTEMTPAGPNMAEGTPGTAVQPMVATLADVMANYSTYEAQLVTIKNLVATTDRTFGTTSATRELVANNGENNISVYNTWGGITGLQVAEGSVMNVTGFIVRYDNKFEIIPRNAADVAMAATLPYFVDFDQYVDEQLVINNGENTNKWFIGQAQGFDNNKLFISSTNGQTNKYNITSTSEVTVTRDIVIPAVGAVVNFDYRVNGQANYDYLKVSMGDVVVTLPRTEGWENYTLNIPGTMAGMQTLTLTWKNNHSNGEQFPAAIDNISITPVACAQVSNLQAAVDSTTATITWTAPEDQTAWTLEYKLANHSEWYSVNATTASVVLNNLQGNSNYDMRVKANCGEASSVWTEGTFAVDCQRQDITVVRADKQIGTATSSNSNLPFYGLYEYSYSQQIFDAAEINASNGLIYSISFYCTTAPNAGTTGGIRIWLGNTTKNSFTSNYDYVNPSELTQVYFNSSDYNFTAGQWHTFVFDQPFAYDGTKNLVVAYYEGKNGWNGSGFQAHSMNNKSIYHYNDDASNVSYTSPASAGGTHSRPSYRSNVKLNMDLQTIACVDPIACPDLVGIEASDVTPNAVTIDWTLAEGSTQDNFAVEYKLENSSDWTVVPVQDATSYELTGLAQKTKYDVRVKAICGENDYSNYVTTSFTTPGVCPAVTNITSTNNANATTLTWQAGGEEGAWTVEFRPVGTENWVSLHVSIVPMTTLGGLAGSTPYEVRIKALCDAQDEANQSLWTNYSFTSGCAAVDVPYTQVFGSYTEPDCWNNQDFEFDYNSYAATNDINAWLMSPAINIPANGASYVSFKVNPTGNYKLMASYRGTALARFAEIYAGTSADGEVIVEIPEIYRGRMVNLMLQNGVDNWFYVYNMKVTTCPFVASQLAVSGLTSSSAVLSWQGDERVSSWNVEYKTTDGEWTSMEVSTNPYTLTGLEASTTYQVRVKAACNETYSNIVTFTTPCPARELPFFEGFEDTEFEPECWMNYHVSGPGTSLWQRNTSSIHTGSGSAQIPDMRATTITNFVTPAFIIPEANAYRVSVWVFRSGTGTTKQNEGIKVWASTEPDINSSSVELFHAHRYIGFAPVQTTTGWYKYEATIPISGNNVYVIFQGICEYGSATYMDDITVERIPTCETPSISISNAVATITPGQIGTPESYDLQIGEEVVTGVQSPADLMLLFPSLQNNTEYEVAVRANCGDEDYSQWSNPVAFITPCAAISLPYTENFDGYTSSTTVSASTMPDCWNRFFTGTSTAYGAGIYPNSTYAHSGNNSLRLYAYYPTTMTATQGDAYAVLPAFSGRLNNMIISFYTRKHSTGTNYVSDFEVGVVTDINNIEGSFVPVQTVSPTSTSYQLVTVRFENYEGADGRIAFRIVNPRATSYRYVYGYVDDLTVETMPTCGTPSLSVTGTMATITPSTIAGTPESYDLQIGNEIQNVTTTSVDLWETFNLESNTEYEVSVRSNCGENDGVSAWSQTVSFRTPCSAVELPIYEDFESAEFPSSCWSKYKVSGSGSYTWASTTTYMHSGSKSAFIKDQSATTINHLVTPQFNLTNAGALLTFWVKRENDYYSNKLQEGVQVLIADNAEGNNASEVIYIHRHINNQPVESAAGWYKYTAAIQKPAGQYYLIFRGYNEYGGATYMDDIAIEAAPSCGTPTIAVDGTRLTITPNSLGNPESYEVMVSGQRQTVTSTTVDLMETFGLELNTNYEVSVRTNCGENDGYSEWTEAIGFTTPACLNAISVAIGTETTIGQIPFYPYYGYSYSQQIFDAAEINASEGSKITDISIYCSSVPSNLSSFGNITIWMTNTSKATYTSTSDFIPYSELTQVYHLNGQYNLVQGWNKITLDEPFEYDGTSNLAVVMNEGMSGYSGDYSGNFYVSSVSGTKTISVYSDAQGSVVPENPASSTGNIATSSSRSNIKFNICPPEVVEKDMRLMEISSGRISCEADPITITVKNTGAIEDITTFVANYSVNEGQAITETVTLPEPLVPGATTTYTLSTVPTYDFGFNTLTVWIELEGVELQYSTLTDYPYLVAPKTVPYVINNVAEEDLLGWNAYDLNNDGITMLFNYNTRSFGYTFNDVVNANDVMISPCMNLTAGSYNVEFDYNALSALNEQFKLGLGAGTELITELGTYSMTDEDTHHASTTVTIAEDGTYNFGFLATSLAGNMGFVISNFAVYPIVNVTVEQPVNGAIAPTGVVAVNYGEDLTLAITPNEMYHVSGVFVDGVQVVNEDPYNSNFMLYTLENVTAAHTVSVEFKLEFHIIKSVENYNAAYTDVPGYFIPAATDTLVDPNPVTVNFRPSAHYHFVALELGIMSLDDPTDVTEDVVANPDGSYSYTIDTLVIANYYLNAIFDRDKVNINYNVLTGKGYANDSEILTAPESYTTVVDHSINGDIDTTVTFAPYTTGDAHSDYHIVDVTVDGQSQGVINDYTFIDITSDHNVGIKFGYEINASIRNYVPSYLGETTVRGTIAPATQLVAEGEATTVTGTIEDHFHLYNMFVDGVDMIDQVVFGENGTYSLTIDNTTANYVIEAVVKIDTFAIYYNVTAGRGYADNSPLLIAPATYSTIVNFGDNFLTNVRPADGFRIENVTVDGDNMYTAPNYQFNYITTDHFINVAFAPETYSVVTNAYGEGTVSDGITFVYDPENPVNYYFVATPAEGYHISAIYINGLPMSEVMDIPAGTYRDTIEDVVDNFVFDVHFAINTYVVNVTSNEGGNTNIQGEVSYNYGQDVNVVATAQEGYYISAVTVDGLTTSYSQTYNRTIDTVAFAAIAANHNVAFEFTIKKFEIAATVDAQANHGTIQGLTQSPMTVNYGENVTLTFVPEANYEVSNVVVDGQSVGAVTSYQFVNINASHNVVVSFAATMYTLTATSNVPSCTITPATTNVQAGSNVNYTLNAAAGYHLLNVIANGQAVVVAANNTFTIENVQSDYSINANFAPDFVTVTVQQPAHATITPGTQTVAYGATPSFVIMPEAGYNVATVTANGQPVSVTYNNGIGNFTLDPVTDSTTVTATTSIKTFTITVVNNAHGTIAPATQTVNYGANQTFTITADQYYVISDVKVDGASRGAISSYTFNNVTTNHTIEAFYEAACYEPINLTATNITTTTADLNWVGTAPSYEVRYRKAGEANWNTQTVTATTVSLSGLDSNTLYAWEVRSICNAQLQSEWVANSFMTRAGVTPVPPVGIASVELNSVKVYSHLNNVYIVNENGVAISSVAIFDINGKQVYTGSVNGSTEVISLDVANGSYIVRLSSENGVAIHKVSIVR